MATPSDVHLVRGRSEPSSSGEATEHREPPATDLYRGDADGIGVIHYCSSNVDLLYCSNLNIRCVRSCNVDLLVLSFFVFCFNVHSCNVLRVSFAKLW